MDTDKGTDDETVRWRASVHDDIATSVETGAPLIGCLSGLHRVTVAGRPFALGLDLERPAMQGGAGIAEVAALADLCLGGAIRDAAGRSLALPTISMTLHLERGAARRTAVAAATATPPRASSAASSAELLTTDREVIGRAQGLFAVPSRPAAGSVPPMPWDGDAASSTPAPSQAVSDLANPTGNGGAAAAHLQVVEDVVAHARGPHPRAWVTSHVVEHLKEVAPGVGELPPVTASANRGGNIQGGLLFALAVLSNPSVHDFGIDDFVTGSMIFVAPGSPTRTLEVFTTALQSSRRTAFCDVRIQQGDLLVAHATTVFRR